MSPLNDSKYVTLLRLSDVLFGRGSGPNDHEGNIRFRQLVAERKHEYMTTNHRLTKSSIAKEIAGHVFAANGRFMKRVEPSELKELGLPEGSDVWEIVGEDAVMEKVKQALRQNNNNNNQKSKEDGISPVRSTPRNVSPHCGISPLLQHQVIGKAESGYHNLRQLSLDFDEIEPIPLAEIGVSHQLISQPYQQHVPVVNPSVPPSWGSPRHRDPGVIDERNMYDIVPQPVYETLPEYDETPRVHRQPTVKQPHLSDGSFRGSINMNELKKLHDRRHMMDINEMTDSFKSLRASDRGVGMFSSVETMGTIEPINNSSAADYMSVGTMESSMFSFVRGNDSDDGEMDEKIARIEAEVGGSMRRSGRPPTAVGSSLTSVGSSAQMSLGSMGTDFGCFFSDQKRLSALSAGSNQSSGKDVDINPLGYQPRTVPELEESAVDFEDFDSSSLSVWKSVLSIDDGPSGLLTQLGDNDNDDPDFASVPNGYSRR